MKHDESDEVWKALEHLRHDAVVTESRAYERRWAQSRSTMQKVRGLFLRPAPLTVAASVCACLAIVFLVNTRRPSDGFLTTAIGEIRQVELADGSKVTLDTNSQVRLAFTPENRVVELLAGQAHFDVTKDYSRPFRVHTGVVEVVAVGTSFDVNTVTPKTIVTLIEGKVDVRSDAPAAVPIVQTLHPGEQIDIGTDGRMTDKSVARVDHVTAWQRKTIDLDDVPLSDALLEINRYSRTKISISDVSLGHVKVSGLFRTGDTKAAVATLERYFDLKADWNGEKSVVLERQ